MTGLRTSHFTLSALALAALIGGVAAPWSSTPASTLVLQEEGTSPDALVERLVELETQVPSLPPSEIVFDENGLTAFIAGDFVGIEVQLEQLEPEARQLFVDADEAGGVIGEAVSDVAQSYVLLREGYSLLATSEINDLSFPVDTVDENEVATGADEARGLVRAGFRIVLQARERMVASYAVLANSEEIDPDAQRLFEVQFETGVDFFTVLAPQIHQLLGFDTTQVLLTIDRFESVAPGVEARARSMEVLCIDRELYEDTDPAAFLAGEGLTALTGEPHLDCPDLPDTNGVTPAGP